MMKKTVKKVMVKPAEIQTFVLETGVPVTSKGYHNPELAEKITNLFKQMKVGQSFVIPKSNKNIVDSIYKRSFIEYKIVKSAIKPDLIFFRVYRVK